VTQVTLEEKIKHLQNASMEEARTEGNEIVKNYSDSLEKIFNEHKEAALRQAELNIKTETNKARQDLNKAMARVQIDLKREQGNCQTALKQKLFRRIGVLVNEYMQTDEYKDLLCVYIQKGLDFARQEMMDIYLNPSDAHLKEEIEQRTGVILTISREDFTGGIRMVIRERNILIDHSFKSALAEEYDRFLFTGGNGYA